MKNILVSLLIFSTCFAIAQNNWTTDELEKANTALNMDYLNETEKQVIFYSNLARINGSLFADTYLQNYINENNISKNTYVISLIKDLKKSEPANPLIPQKDLYEAALYHAKTSGKNGSVGHQNFNVRTKGLIKKYNSLGENCDYGSDEALAIVLNLLIDENIPNLGHRKNILNPAFAHTGAAIHQHKRYKVNTVIIYAGQTSLHSSK
jgi:uncharacterized protein YkwD